MVGGVAVQHAGPGAGRPLTSASAAVLVAAVGPDAGLGALLAALQSQDVPVDVVVADRTGRPPRDGVVSLSADPRTSVYRLRRLALQACDARYVLVTEDHCVPPPRWARTLIAALDADPGAVAAAGPVHDGRPEAAWDRASFLVDYAPLLPDGSSRVRAVDALPGMNTIYRREHLAAVLDEAPDLFDDLWELGVHRRLAARGRFLRVPGADIAHCKRWGAGHAIAQRFLQSRHVAGRRAAGLPLAGRIAWSVAAAGVPARILPRVLGPAVSRGGVRGSRWLTTLPPLAALVGVWAAGEAVGALLGPGTALERVE